jgi:galactokinase
MAEHSQLVAEMAYVERLQLPERLRLAKKRRMQQLKAYVQREKQLIKAANGAGKRNNKRGSRDVQDSELEALEKQNKRHLRFADSVLLLDAVARSDIDEGKVDILRNSQSLLTY